MCEDSWTESFGLRDSPVSASFMLGGALGLQMRATESGCYVGFRDHT